MIAPRRVCMLLATLALASPVALLQANPPAGSKEREEPKFIRIQRDAKGQAVALETAVARYTSATGGQNYTVDLIGAIHVGDRAYYDKLNKLFEDYDVLLYELVAPQGTRIPRGGKQSDNPIAFLQQMMKNVLDLDLQLEHVDYTKKNFVHADLSPDDMAQAMHKRGETPLTLVLSIFADMMRQQNLQELKKQKSPAKDEEDLDLLSLLLDPDSGMKLKRAMADQLADLSGAGALGNTLTTLLIADRNQAAVKVLEKEIAKGRRKIGIFYGVAHLPDFDKRLRGKLGLKATNERWLVAWDLQSKKKSGNPLLKLLEP
jgi:hypothetical protein